MKPEEMLAALEKAKADLAAAETLITEQAEKLNTLNATVTNHETAISALTQERDEAKAKADTIPALEVKVLALETVDHDFNSAVAKKVAELGIAQTAAAASPTEKTGQQLAEEYLAIKDPRARAAFYADHAKELEALAFKRN